MWDFAGGWHEANGKKFTTADRELSVEAGDLTPSMKLRRKVVIERFSDQPALLGDHPLDAGKCLSNMRGAPPGLTGGADEAGKVARTRVGE